MPSKVHVFRFRFRFLFGVWAEILNEGTSRYIAIGLCHRRYSPNRQPGWDSGSVGYHADDGGWDDIFSGYFSLKPPFTLLLLSDLKPPFTLFMWIISYHLSRSFCWVIWNHRLHSICWVIWNHCLHSIYVNDFKPTLVYLCEWFQTNITVYLCEWFQITIYILFISIISNHHLHSVLFEWFSCWRTWSAMWS